MSRPAAAVLCDDLNLPNKVYGAGGSEITPTHRRLAVALADDPEAVPEEQTTLFYADPNTCAGYADFAAGKSSRTFKYWVAGAAAAETDETCEARVGGQPLDFAHAQGSLEECEGVGPVAGVLAYPATVQSVSIVTGADSVETSISAEALHLIYSRGPEGQVSPWTDGAAIFAPTSSVALFLGKAIRLPPERFHDDYVVGASSRLQSLINYSTTPVRASQAIYAADTATVDLRRGGLKVLAYQHFGQSCGVWPDSTPSSFDKLNVRLGKYALWNQGRFFTRAPINARVQNLIGWFDGSARPPGSGVHPLTEVIKAGNVPDCAMQVRQDEELGALSSYATQAVHRVLRANGERRNGARQLRHRQRLRRRAAELQFRLLRGLPPSGAGRSVPFDSSFLKEASASRRRGARPPSCAPAATAQG